MAESWYARIALVEVSEGPHEEIAERLKRRGSSPTTCLQNVVTVLEDDPRWRNRIRLNAFDLSPYLTLPDRAPERMTDEAETGLALWLARVYGFEPPTARVGEAVRYIAGRHAYHPVREYLDGLTWDGVERCADLLPLGFGAEATPLNRALGVRFLLSLVARVKDPGCKVDTVVILAGEQGARKSSALAVLAVKAEWFSDSSLDLRSKDAKEALPGVWIYELGELDSMRRSEVTAVKAFLSSRVDRFRPAYARNTVRVERQTVFVGTTNQAEFLNDSSGSRRFWPVQVTTCDLEWLRAHRDQLWAEAVARYQGGEQWWLTEAEEADRAEVAELFSQSDSWESAISTWLENPRSFETRPNGERVAVEHLDEFTTADVLLHAIEKPTERQTKGDAMRVSDLLKGLGCEKRRRRIGNQRAHFWVRPGGAE